LAATRLIGAPRVRCGVSVSLNTRFVQECRLRALAVRKEGELVMRILKVAAAALIAVSFVAVSVAPALAQDKKDEKKAETKKDDKKDDKSKGPEVSAQWKAYVDYVNGLAKATKLEDLYQYFNTTSVDFFKGIPSGDRLKMLQSLKDQMIALGAFSGTMRLVREESEPTATYLILESTANNNKKVQGRVKMVRELGWVKVASVPTDEDWKEVK
jgi:hypothetical protein